MRVQKYNKIYIVRHAERLDSSSDSQLSATGRERAQRLCSILCNEKIDLITTTDYRRTIDTAMPTALYHGLEIVNISRTDSIIRAIEGMEASACGLVVGHNNTVPEIIASLGGPSVMIEGEDYSNLYILFLVEGRVRETAQLFY